MTRRAARAAAHPVARAVAVQRHVQQSFYWSIIVKRAAALFRRFVSDDRGGEVLEYVLIAGLIVVATIVVIGAVGTKVLARWTTVNDGM
jgi:Flp pilus assembly pilin Flp